MYSLRMHTEKLFNSTRYVKQLFSKYHQSNIYPIQTRFLSKSYNTCNNPNPQPYTSHYNYYNKQKPSVSIVCLPFHSFCTTANKQSSINNINQSSSSNFQKTEKPDDSKPTLKLSLRDGLNTILKGNIGGVEFRRLWSFIKIETPWIYKGIGCMIVSTSVTMAVPATFGYIIDIATGAKIGLSISELSVVFSTLFITGGIFNALRVYIFTRVGHNIVRRIRHSLFDNVINQEIQFFDNTSTGELINRLSTDTSIMGESLGGLQLSGLLRNAAQIIGSFSVMMYLSPDLTLVMTALIPIGVSASIFYGRFVRDTQQKVQTSLSESTSFAEEKLSNIRTVRYFANENNEKNIYFNKINKVYNLAMLQTKGSSIFFGSTGAVGNVFLLGVLLYGANLVQSGLITSGLLTSCLLYSVYIAMGAVGITSSFAGIMKGIGASTRVFELMDRETLIDNNFGNNIKYFNGNIEFNNVCFNYPTRKESIILSDFNLSVPPGNALAIVGESGSGKSTLISLLLRFYDINSGSISIDGYNISDLSPNCIRNEIGVVSQEPILFTGTIRDNILYGLQNNKDIDMDNYDLNNLYKISHEANCHDFIMDFPDKYDTIIGENGVNLSGGQKQRIAIARALIKNPSILLLDEATSALDSSSESLVADALQKSMKNRTTIVIAHRLSTIKNADIIAVLKNGQIIEIGNHDQLINKGNSYYSELIKTQLY